MQRHHRCRLGLTVFMRILLLASTFHPAIGGAETYALVLACALGALGDEVEIVTDMVPGVPEYEVIARNVRIRRLYRYRTRFGAADTILWEEMQFGLRPELAFIASTFLPEVVMSNSLDLCVPAKLIGITFGIPWVATFHEQAPERDAMGLATLQLSFDLLQPDAVIAGSRLYLDRARRFGREERCHLIYHGVDSDRFCEIDSADEVKLQYGIPREHALLVSAGRLKARKGFLDVIRAVAMLVEMGRMVSLVIAGSLNSASSAYFEGLKQEVQLLGLDRFVHFDEFVLHERMPWLLAGASVVVQASHEEGLGLAVIEAMACGRPLVATRIPGHMEIIENENQAVLVDPCAPAQLAVAIAELLDNAERRTVLGLNARSQAVAKFSVHRMTCATAELLRNVTRQPSNHAH